MRRIISVSVVVAVLVGLVSIASAGGKHHHGNNSALWWGVGAGVALGTLGAIAASRYPPAAYPPVVTYPRYATHLYCPPLGAYYPYVPACPTYWVPVQVPY